MNFSSSIPCDKILNLEQNEIEFSYAQCPDVDECALHIHDCNPNADCTNTHGSFKCQCRKGFVGDGKKNCVKTCFEKCIHGVCSGEPEFKCECDLGWTGSDCSIDCGCNFRSTCESGYCDSCQMLSEGKFCEKCVSGSFGNATDCQKCDCNDHGDESLGFCNGTTGECYCKDFTEGKNCENCIENYYGDARDGGQCFYQCSPLVRLDPSARQGIGSFKAYRPPWGGAPTQECIWIISPNIPDKIGNYIIRMQILREETNVSCARNAIYIYDGIPDFNSSTQHKQLISVYCDEDESHLGEIEAKSGYLTVHYSQGIKGEGFNAIITVESCSLNTCKHPYECNQNGKCSCPESLWGPHCVYEKCPSNCNSNTSFGNCDPDYGQCICKNNFFGEDCSQVARKFNLVVSEKFNSQKLSESFEHLKKTIPRFGHTLVYDRRGSLWMFGGYSLSHGALNDIRQFDVKNNTWLQVSF